MWKFLKSLFFKQKVNPLLQKGSSDSESVKKLQTILRDQGYFNGLIGGNFGEMTESAVIYFQQTHIGEDKLPLKPDGVVGEKTWWALLNPSGESQRQNLKPTIIDEHPQEIGSMAKRKSVLRFCNDLHALNIHEIPDGSNTGGYVTQFHKWFGMPPAPWCAMVVNWILFKVLGSIPWGKKIAHVATLWNFVRNLQLHKRLSLKDRPTPGDLFVMVHSNGTGHIGIVAGVSKDGKVLDVFEGNSGNRFALRRRDVGKNDHIGYINYLGDWDDPPYFPPGLADFSTFAPANTR